MGIKNKIANAKSNYMGAAAIASMFLLGNAYAASDKSLLARLPDFFATLHGLTILVSLAGALIGIGVMIAGGFQLKKYADDSRSVSPVKGILYLVGGVLMFAISATSESMKATIFGEADDSGDYDFKKTTEEGRAHTFK